MVWSSCGAVVGQAGQGKAGQQNYVVVEHIRSVCDEFITYVVEPGGRATTVVKGKPMMVVGPTSGVTSATVRGDDVSPSEPPAALLLFPAALAVVPPGLGS